MKISDGSTPGVFSTIGGEGTWSKKVSTEQIDLSSKDDGKIKAQGWGQQTITFSVSGKVKLPDTGLEKDLRRLQRRRAGDRVQLVKGGVVKWQGHGRHRQLLARRSVERLGHLQLRPDRGRRAVGRRPAPPNGSAKAAAPPAQQARGPAANAARGEHSLSLGGKSYRLRPSFAATVAIEEELGQSALELLRRANAGALATSSSARSAPSTSAPARPTTTS
jgi:hypothetical protein